MAAQPVPEKPTIEWARRVWQDMQISHSRHHLSAGHQEMLRRAEQEYRAEQESQRAAFEESQTPCEPVENVSVPRVVGNACIVTWQKPASGPAPDYYRVRLEKPDGSWSAYGGRVRPGRPFQMVVRRLSPGANLIRVGASRDSAGMTWSQPVSVIYEPSTQKP